MRSDARRWTLSLGMGSALVACLAIGVPGSAGAATLDFTGTLRLQIFPSVYLGPAVIPLGGSAQVTDDGSFHLLSFTLPGGAFGPINMSLPITSGGTIQSVRLTGVGNLSGSFSGISGGPPGGGPMGLTGLAKICFGFAPACGSDVPLQLSSTAGGAGFGIGGTATFPGNVAVTMQNAPWTIGQPVMTFHTPNTTVWTPVLPGGFAHGPASLTSSTAQASGVVQLVTVSKVFTSLTTAFPDFPLTGVLTLHFVPEPGTLLLLGLGVAGLTAHGRWRRRR